MAFTLQPLPRTVTFGAPAMRKLVFLLSFLLAARLRSRARTCEGPGLAPDRDQFHRPDDLRKRPRDRARQCRDPFRRHRYLFRLRAIRFVQSATCFCSGHVRIYRGVSLYLGEKATYNLDTKAIQAHAECAPALIPISSPARP